MGSSLPPLTINSISSISITPRCSTRVTGPPTKNLDPMTMTAPLLNPTTGREPNNALSPGNAEAPECAREVDGAPASMDVKDPHSQPKLQAFPTPTEQTSHLRYQCEQVKLKVI